MSDAKLGAIPDADGTTFRVWVPTAQQVMVSVVTTSGVTVAVPLLAEESAGYFSGHVTQAHTGNRYQFCLGQRGGFPDPASRFQPDGVHGPSEVIDPSAFAWSDLGWSGVEPESLVIYELHVGTFSPEGTFEGVRRRLPYLKGLGVTAIQLMPVADFPGRWNWGYDGVSLFAPSRTYGRPDDLRRLVDEAHLIGLGVILDVVYNHLGPDGNFLGQYSPGYFTDRYSTPWGSALNFDGERSADVRAFFIANALHWVREYHLDGLRLDATHAIIDHGPRHFLAELTDTVRRSVPDRRILFIAEDHRNLAEMVKPTAEGGLGMDAVWADGFHHQMRRLLAGDSEGYFGDYTGSPEDLATTIQQGWFYCGQYSRHLKEPRGTETDGLPPRSFVHCIQNHDQIGNRALGDRLNHAIAPAAYRAATVLLLCSPSTPLLFMGQEWAAGTPFRYFTDHNAELGALVTAGRREEFKAFKAFADPAEREEIPDPQAPETFESSRLDWSEPERTEHAGVLQLHRTLLALRRSEPALRQNDRDGFTVEAVSEEGVALRIGTKLDRTLLVVAHFGEKPGMIELDDPAGADRFLSTEDAEFCQDQHPITTESAGGMLRIRFERSGAIVFTQRIS